MAVGVISEDVYKRQFFGCPRRRLAKIVFEVDVGESLFQAILIRRQTMDGLPLGLLCLLGNNARLVGVVFYCVVTLLPSTLYQRSQSALEVGCEVTNHDTQPCDTPSMSLF